MTNQTAPTAAGRLDDIDRRQDEVLQQLDQLDSEVIALLDELGARLSSFSDHSTVPMSS